MLTDEGRLTIQQAADATGWSPRMLRYVGNLGLLEPARTPSGYRLYGDADVARLKTLKALLGEHGVELGDVGFALRMQRDGRLREAVGAWLEAVPAPAPPRPLAVVIEPDWLRYEQDKQQRLLAGAMHEGAMKAGAFDTPARHSA